MFIHSAAEAAISSLPAAGGDIFGWANSMFASTKSAAIAGGGAIATLLVVIAAWRTKGALTGVVSGFVVAVLVVFAVANADNSNIQQKVKNTVTNGSGPISTSTHTWPATVWGGISS